MKNSFDVIKTLLRTEKGTLLELQNKYLFMVARDATRPQIKTAIEEIYKVKVGKVNTTIMPSKLKKVRYQVGRTSIWKKAFVTLEEGSKIEVT